MESEMESAMWDKVFGNSDESGGDGDGDFFSGSGESGSVGSTRVDPIFPAVCPNLRASLYTHP